MEMDGECSDETFLELELGLVWDCSVIAAGSVNADWTSTQNPGYIKLYTDLIIFGADVSENFEQRFCNGTSARQEDSGSC